MEFSKLKQNFSLRISTPKHFPFDVAQTLQKDLEELCKKHDEVFVCLSGGQTPLETYKILGSDFYNSISWQNIVFFVGDERVTDIEHDINSFNIRKSFSIDTLRLVDWYGNNSRLSIEYFNETLARLGVVENGFHLLLLGLGEDGHLAGLFPGSNYDDLVVCESMVPSSGQKRVSIGPRLIKESKKIYVLVKGKNKSAIIKKIFTEHHDPMNVPAEILFHSNNPVTFFVDEEAISLLNIKT